MINLKQVYGAVLVIALLISGCSDHTVAPPEPELANGRVVGTVSGIISDFTTEVPFDSGSVTITWIDNGVTHSTACKNLGYYLIDSLTSGTHEIYFQGPVSHAQSKITVTIPELNDILDCCPVTNKDYRHNVTENITLYKRSNHIEGIIFYKFNDNTTALAEGVTVVADYRYTFDSYSETVGEGYNVIPARYVTTTNSSGFFSFDSLPCTPTVVIQSLPYTKSGIEYESYITQVSLSDGSSHSIGDVIINPVSAVPIITQNNFVNNNDFPVTSSFIATFSKKMNPYTFDINLYRSGTLIETNISWTDSLILTIDPYADLRPDEDYTLSISGKSVDNNTFSQTYNIHTQAGIEFVSTNLEVSQGIMDTKFPVESNIEITFSMAVNLSNPNTYVHLIDDQGFYVDVNISLTGDQKTLVINPVGNLEYDKTYTVSFKVYSSIPDDYITQSETGLSFIFSTEPEITVVPGQVTGFALDMGSSWHADYNTLSISFVWNTVAHADEYKILARDNDKNTDYVYLKSFTATDNVLKQTGSINLSTDAGGQFDYYEDDGKITPFCNGNEISFYIVAINKIGQSVLSSPVVVKDEVSPAMELIQYSSANNSSPNSVTISIDFNGLGAGEAEYLGNDLTVSIAEAGGDNNYVLTSDKISYQWYNNMTGATIYLTIPANSNASGDRLTVNCKDTSGNSSSASLILF